MRQIDDHLLPERSRAMPHPRCIRCGATTAEAEQGFLCQPPQGKCEASRADEIEEINRAQSPEGISVMVRKTWRVDWEDKLVKGVKRLFRRV